MLDRLLPKSRLHARLSAAREREGTMIDMHFACAAMNFIGFLGFVTAILVITAETPNGGHGARPRHAQRALAFARVT